MKDSAKSLKSFLEKYFSLLGIEGEFDIKENPDNYIIINIKTKGDVAGLLIGNKGKNLYALQLIMNCISKKDDQERRVVVDVDGWREKDNQRLRDLSEKTAQKVISTGESQTLYNLTPSQRRIVHTYLSENEQIKTESFGEGEERYLVITSNKPQK